ncbi:hypothetical protein KFK09_006138 [Dendrobium nobile]|uniref:Uncharacterized protein n=1 Tax=Dendrobium nobile TaxID=94219 RepID=A0A8T3BNI2_DENNO|nr:hypothetical protein KFK09_006138 [Dendrobium nobile]
MSIRRHCLLQFRPIFLTQNVPPFSSSFSSYSSSSKHPPSRRGRQAVRRLLKLLPLPENSPNPQLSDAIITLRTSPESLTSVAIAALISAVGDPLLSFNFYRFLRCSASTASIPFSPDAAVYSSLLGTQLLSRSPHLPRIRFYLSEAKRLGVSFSPAALCSLISPLLPDRLNIVILFLQELLRTLGPASGFSAGTAAVFVKNGLTGGPMEPLLQLKQSAWCW